MGFNFRVSILSYRKRRWHPTSVLLPGKSHGWRSLVSCSPWGHEESDTTECLPFHFSLSCIGEGNGNPLQCSCLENPRDGGAWWAAVYGVAWSRTRLKRLSSSSSKRQILRFCWHLFQWLWQAHLASNQLSLNKYRENGNQRQGIRNKGRQRARRKED